jgi:hypothetical protein
MARARAERLREAASLEGPRNAGAGYGMGFRGMSDETLKELRKVLSQVAPRLVVAGKGV